MFVDDKIFANNEPPPRFFPTGLFAGRAPPPAKKRGCIKHPRTAFASTGDEPNHRNLPTTSWRRSGEKRALLLWTNKQSFHFIHYTTLAMACQGAVLDKHNVLHYNRTSFC
ncbi:hypothetical protein B4113_0717 [Geobacillus sp. B4113_201601]|nr:hypothetical protein B4113_0717 [Geobacillus sp. B4113_201601]